MIPDVLLLPAATLASVSVNSNNNNNNNNNTNNISSCQTNEAAVKSVFQLLSRCDTNPSIFLREAVRVLANIVQNQESKIERLEEAMHIHSASVGGPRRFPELLSNPGSVQETISNRAIPPIPRARRFTIQPEWLLNNIVESQTQSQSQAQSQAQAQAQAQIHPTRTAIDENNAFVPHLSFHEWVKSAFTENSEERLIDLMGHLHIGKDYRNRDILMLSGGNSGPWFEAMKLVAESRGNVNAKYRYLSKPPQLSPANSQLIDVTTARDLALQDITERGWEIEREELMLEVMIVFQICETRKECASSIARRMPHLESAEVMEDFPIKVFRQQRKTFYVRNKDFDSCPNGLVDKWVPVVDFRTVVFRLINSASAGLASSVRSELRNLKRKQIDLIAHLFAKKSSASKNTDQSSRPESVVELPHFIGLLTRFVLQQSSNNGDWGENEMLLRRIQEDVEHYERRLILLLRVLEGPDRCYEKRKAGHKREFQEALRDGYPSTDQVSWSEQESEQLTLLARFGSLLAKVTEVHTA